MKPTNAPLNGAGPGSGPGVKRELEQRQLREERGRQLRDRLRYHVTGAIERGEAEAITEIPAN